MSTYKAGTGGTSAPGAIIRLSELIAQNKMVEQNTGASLIDVGDGIACLEFHTNSNAIDQDIARMITIAVDRVATDFDGLIIANHAPDFSVGTDLTKVLAAAENSRWGEIDQWISEFQTALRRLKQLSKPVVAAPAGQALARGCEICLAADRIRCATDVRLGLVETSWGLIPAGGGVKELLVRATEHLFDGTRGMLVNAPINLRPFVARAFETMAGAKVSSSAAEAAELGLLRTADTTTADRQLLISDAKKTVQSLLLIDYRPPDPLTTIRVGGAPLLAFFKLMVWSMCDARYITAHDATVLTELARVCCGGGVQPNTEVSEQYLLDLEREAFLRLCGTEQTRARLDHLIKTGEPLKN